MDYKEEYQKALERAKKGLPIDEVFPELKASEDERIREQIEQVLIEHDWSATYKVSKDDCLAYLERQKEQQPAEWSEEEKLKLNRIYAILGQAADTHAFSTTCRLIGDKEAVELQDFLRSIAKPESGEWSEEDEKMLNGIIERGNSEIPKGECGLKPNQVAWLETRFKSLRSHWKPSEEQMKALNKVIHEVPMSLQLKDKLIHLEDELKKLM